MSEAKVSPGRKGLNKGGKSFRKSLRGMIGKNKEKSPKSEAAEAIVEEDDYDAHKFFRQNTVRPDDVSKEDDDAYSLEEGVKGSDSENDESDSDEESVFHDADHDLEAKVFQSDRDPASNGLIVTADVDSDSSEAFSGDQVEIDDSDSDDDLFVDDDEDDEQTPAQEGEGPADEETENFIEPADMDASDKGGNDQVDKSDKHVSLDDSNSTTSKTDLKQESPDDGQNNTVGGEDSEDVLNQLHALDLDDDDDDEDSDEAIAREMTADNELGGCADQIDHFLKSDSFAMEEMHQQLQADKPKPTSPPREEHHELLSQIASVVDDGGQSANITLEESELEHKKNMDRRAMLTKKLEMSMRRVQAMEEAAENMRATQENSLRYGIAEGDNEQSGRTVTDTATAEEEKKDGSIDLKETVVENGVGNSNLVELVVEIDKDVEKQLLSLSDKSEVQGTLIAQQRKIVQLEMERDANAVKISELVKLMRLTTKEQVDEHLNTKALEISRLKGEKKALEGKLRDSEKTSKTLRREQTELFAAVKDLSTTVRLYEEHNKAELEKKLAVAEENEEQVKNGQVLSHTQALELTIVKLQKKIEQLAEDKAELTSTATTLNRTVSELKDENDACQMKLEAIEASFLILNQRDQERDVWGGPQEAAPSVQDPDNNSDGQRFQRFKVWAGTQANQANMWAGQAKEKAVEKATQIKADYEARKKMEEKPNLDFQLDFQ